MLLDNLIHQYGYLVLVLGTLLEGETVLLMAGFAARCGHLSFQWVVFWAFVGSTLGDQLWFYVGHKKGRKYLAERSRLSARVRRVISKFEQYQLLVLLGFRFVYGLRSIAPLVIGASGFSPTRFLALNIVTAAIWSVVVAGLGYVFGQAMERIFQDAKVYEVYVLVALAVGGGMLWLLNILRRRAS